MEILTTPVRDIPLFSTHGKSRSYFDFQLPFGTSHNCYTRKGCMVANKMTLQLPFGNLWDLYVICHCPDSSRCVLTTPFRDLILKYNIVILGKGEPRSGQKRIYRLNTPIREFGYCNITLSNSTADRYATYNSLREFIVFLLCNIQHL
jgi:hypothetical protein